MLRSLRLQIMLVALQTQKGQMAFSAPVGKVSFFTALVADDVLEVAILFDGSGSASGGRAVLAPGSCGRGSSSRRIGH